MAKTLNRTLVGGLTFGGMVVLAAAGFLLLANLPGRDPKVYEDEAKKHETEKEWNKAVQAYMRACQRDPGHNPEYLVSAARCAIEDGDVGMARNLVTKARVSDPQIRSATRLMAEFELEVSKLFPSSQQWNRLLTEAKKLVDAEKDSGLGHRALGTAYLSLQKEDASFRDKGREELKRALELEPGNADIVELLARDQWAAGIEKQEGGSRQEGEELEKAATAMVTAAIEKCPADKGKDRGKLERLLALYNLMKGDFDKTISILQALAAKQGDDDAVETYLMLGAIYSGSAFGNNRMDLDKAAESLNKAMTMVPKDGRAYQGLSQINKQRREKEKDVAKRKALIAQDVELFKKGLAAIPKTKHFRDYADNAARVSFFVELCMIELDRAGEKDTDAATKKASIESAESWADQLKREIDPSSVEARFVTASILNVKGDYIAATKEAETADRSNEASRHVRLQALLSELYMRQSQWGSAIKALKKSLEIIPSSAILKIRLAQVYLQTNEPTLALAELKPMTPGPLRDYLEKDEFASQLRMEAYRLLGQTELASKEAEKLSAGGSTGDDMRDIRLLMTEQRYNEAEAKLKPMVAKDSSNDHAVRMLFRVYEATDRMADAKALLADVMGKQKDNSVYRRLMLIILESNTEPMIVITYFIISK